MRSWSARSGRSARFQLPRKSRSEASPRRRGGAEEDAEKSLLLRVASVSPRLRREENLHAPVRERHIRENFGDVRIVVAVPIPRPAHAGIQHLAGTPDLLEARTVDAPHV